MQITGRETRAPAGAPPGLNFGPALTPGQEYALEALASPSGYGAELRDVEVRTLLELAAETPGPWLGGSTPYAPGFGPKRWIRDLLGKAPADSAGSVVYVQEIETATTDGGASATDEGGEKPETEIQFDGGRQRVGKVTAWIPATDEVYEDAHGLAAYVDGRLSEQLFARENYELLNGDGTAPNLRGLLTGWSGVQSQTSVNGDPFASIALAIAKVEKKRTIVDGVIMNTDAYWTGMQLRHANVLDSAAIDQQGRVYGRPTITTPDIAAGTALVGSFRVGATLREYGGVTIRTSDSHSDFFVKGKRAVVAEVQEALVVHRPDYFCTVSVDVTP